MEVWCKNIGGETETRGEKFGGEKFSRWTF